MKKIGFLVLSALAAAFIWSPVAARAFEPGTLYVTPKIMYSYETFDSNTADLYNGAWTYGVLGGAQRDGNFGAGLAVGFNLGAYSETPLRLEAEYAYRSQASISQHGWAAGTAIGQSLKTSAHSIFGNVYYDFYTTSALTPYLGGGLGLAYLDSEYSAYAGAGQVSGSTGDWNLAWNLGAGLAYQINDSLALDFGYRYVDLGKVTKDSVSYPTGTYLASPSNQADLTAHEFVLGLRFSGF